MKKEKRTEPAVNHGLRGGRCVRPGQYPDECRAAAEYAGTARTTNRLRSTMAIFKRLDRKPPPDDPRQGQLWPSFVSPFPSEPEI